MIPLRKYFKISGIYAIRNIITGKLYIGSAVNIGDRLHKHRGRLRSNIHPNKHLQLAWNKYWEQSFEFIILEYVEDVNLLLHAEECWIEYHSTYKKEFGYNARRKPNSNLGLKFSEETKAKISASNIGKHSFKRRPWTEEERLKISKRNKGKKHSPEHIAKRVAINSKPNKWPHGYKCKCKPCMKLKSQAVRAKQIENARTSSGY